MALQAVPNIVMNGKAREAIGFYQKVFGAEVVFQSTVGERPNYQENEKNLIAHAVLKIGESQIMMSDLVSDLPFQDGSQISLCIVSDDLAASKKMFNQLKEKGTVLMELTKTHFTLGYGIVTDQFGVTFQISTAG